MNIHQKSAKIYIHVLTLMDLNGQREYLKIEILVDNRICHQKGIGSINSVGNKLGVSVRMSAS